MKWVNVKEARLIDQWLHSSIASATWGDVVNFFHKDITTIFKVTEELSKSELYKAVGWDIEKKAEEIVEAKCKPEWNRISEEMKPLGEERNNLWKEKAASKENNDTESWTEEKENRLNEIDKKMSDLSAEYQKVTDDANAELNEYKEKRINEEQGAAFLLEDDEYELIRGYCWF